MNSSCVILWFSRRHYAIRADGCGLDLENNLRRSFQMFIHRLIDVIKLNSIKPNRYNVQVQTGTLYLLYSTYMYMYSIQCIVHNKQYIHVHVYIVYPKKEVEYFFIGYFFIFFHTIHVHNVMYILRFFLWHYAFLQVLQIYTVHVHVCSKK